MENTQQEAPFIPDTPPSVPQEVEERGFNSEERSGMEDAYAAFKASEQEEPPEPQTPVAPVMDTATPSEDQGGMAVPAPTPVIEEPSRPPALKYRSHEEAEEGYRNAERKMHEAAEKARRIEEENSQLRTVSLQLLEGLKQGTVQPTAPQAMPPVDPEELQTYFYEKPIDFIFQALGSLKNDLIRTVEAKQEAKFKEVQTNTAKARFNVEANNYFDSKYSGLKPIQATVVEKFHEAWADQNFMAPILAENKPPIEKWKKVMDEAVSRVRDTVIPNLSGVIPAGSEQRVRLSGGAIAPASSGISPMVRLTPVSNGETPQDYVNSRIKAQEQAFYGR
jgi:hypothetical protein